MILLVARSRQVLPPLPISAGCRRLLLSPGRPGAEAKLRAELESGRYQLVISTGFAVAADQRLQPGELLLATRIFGGADVFLDVPALEAPGAIRGSLCTVLPEDAQDAAWPSRHKRLPPVHAFDDHAFWLARLAQAADVPCLVLRSVLLPAGAVDNRPDPLLLATPALTAGGIATALARMPRRWREGPAMLRAASRCRRQLASALTVLLVLHDRPAAR